MPFNFTVPQDPNSPYPGASVIPDQGPFMQMVMGQQGGNPSNQGADSVQLQQLPASNDAGAPPQSPAPADNQPSPPVANSNTPSPATPESIQLQPQGPSAAQIQSNALMGRQAVQAGGDNGTMRQMFSDPQALMAMAAVMGNAPNFGESGIGQLARAMNLGNQVVAAKNYQTQQELRQNRLDAQAAETAQSEDEYRAAQTAQTQTNTQQSQDLFQSKKEQAYADIDATKARVASMQAGDAKTKAETALLAQEQAVKARYGDRLAAAQAAQAEAQVDQTKSTTDENKARVPYIQSQTNLTDAEAGKARIEREKAQAWMEQYKAADPATREFMVTGGKSQKNMTDDDKFNAWFEKVQKGYQMVDPDTNQPAGYNYTAAMRQYGEMNPDSKYAKMHQGEPTQAQAESAVRAKLKTAGDTPQNRQKLNGYLKSNGYNTIDNW